METEIIESKKAYIAPQAKVIEVNVREVLCQSGTRYREDELDPDIFN